ncbi:hypothetical protein GTP44_08250 [Duganella sp. FT50W]|uniref:DP-EP family protein n=1 Tax=Duganella lactea TaxID=2692173 RepID=A0A6L8MG11_9BURK|nr:hypothetical protein [Duganella lactea]MYM81950.1 hypothetical protein [Duganella lactea]
MSKLNAATQFINILVKVKPGTTPGTYEVQTAPAVPCVTEPDTVLNYQIYDSGDKNVVFAGVTVVPEAPRQFSPASISVSGKQLTFSDANTVKMTLNITLQFKDEDGLAFSHDPQVVNEPGQQ